MPIQFRCQFCQQRLGIADSKAGAVVDCPACGRSLRVPGVDGNPVALPATPDVRADAQLQSALQQLSVLASGAPADSHPTPSAAPTIQMPVVRRTAGSPAVAAKPSMTEVSSQSSAARNALLELATLPESTAEDLPLLEQPELLAETPDNEDPLISNPEHSETADETSSSAAPLAAVLAELAVQHLPTPVQPRHVALRRIFSLLIPVLTSLMMFAAGYLVARSPAAKATSTEAAADAEVRPGGVSTEMQPGGAEAGTVALADEKRSGVIFGIVDTVGSDGKSTPDAGALVIVAPFKNPTELRIDGRFLRDPPTSAARLALTAALAQLGVNYTQAADDGKFSLPQPPHGPCVLIAVSRHRARPASVPLASDVAAGLEQWFTSVSPVTGRLQAVMQTFNASAGDQGAVHRITIPAN